MQVELERQVMKKTHMAQDSDISKVLGVDQASGRKTSRNRWFILRLLVLLAVAVMFLLWTGGRESGLQYTTQDARIGNLTVTVTATGNLEPTNKVTVGSELSGIIESVEVDYNQIVKVGQVLARLDTDQLKSQVLQAKAALESAMAKFLEAQVMVSRDRKELDRLQHARERSGGKVPSQHELDITEAAFKCAEAELASARAQITETRARLDYNETDLAKAVIRAPINGIVLSRNIDPGQTVAASFQAPVLFTLAEDLTKMELHVDVDEADVGQVQEGQQALFTVAAYPDRSFPAQIIQVRYGSQEVDGVITYETVLNVDNSDLSLRPGMTATSDITVEKIENIVLLPNAGLRFTPPVEEKEISSGGSLLGSLFRRPASRSKKQAAAKNDMKEQRVWVLQKGQPITIPVTVGLSDGIMTELVAGDIEAGTPIIIDAVGVQ